jgi:hypothetical protein
MPIDAKHVVANVMWEARDMVGKVAGEVRECNGNLGGGNLRMV